MPSEKFYMVTFDLLNSAARTNDYKKAEDALIFSFGPNNYWKPLKQCAFVRTDRGPVAIRNTLSQRLGTNMNILVVRVRREHALKIKNPTKFAEATAFFRQIPRSIGG